MAIKEKKVEEGLLTRDVLLSQAKFEITKLDFEDGSFVYVRQMSGQGRDRFEQSLMKEVKKGKSVDFERSLTDFRAKLAVNTLCNKEGELLLHPGDFGTLSRNMTAYQLERIVNESQKINAISDEDKENLVKNSEGDQVAK